MRRADEHLISMDLQMPRMNGLEAIQMIRQPEDLHGRTRAARIIAITSCKDTGSIDEAFRQLADAYIVKPIHRASWTCRVPVPRARGEPVIPATGSARNRLLD
ncbi:MAG TPA: response regulator [Candidatus Solibacter sp.]|nr:response regulator [Candidatus Solibacter sp.]